MEALPLTAIVALRTSVRHDLFAAKHPQRWDFQGCWQVSEAIAARWSWAVAGGCYVAEDDTHYIHAWNILPDGRLLDATADQFGEEAPGVRIAAADDARYDATCDGERCGTLIDCQDEDGDGWGGV